MHHCIVSTTVLFSPSSHLFQPKMVLAFHSETPAINCYGIHPRMISCRYPVQIPVGTSAYFRGMVDLVTMKPVLYQAGIDGRDSLRAAARFASKPHPLSVYLL